MRSNAAAIGVDRLVADVVREVEGAPPERAGAICLGAAEQFRDFARRRENGRVAALLAARANEFQALANEYEAYAGAARAPRATVDDFEEQEAEHAQAHAEVGHLDDLEIRARRNQLHEMRRELPRVSIAPASLKETTLLGKGVTLRFNPSVADVLNNIVQSDTCVLWQGSPLETQAFSVDIGVVSFPAYLTAASVRPYGIITYGAGGFNIFYQFDVLHGVRLSGVGNYCSVLLAMGAPGFSLASGTMLIGASLGFFSAPVTTPVTFTTYVDGLTAAAPATAAIPIPSRARYLLPPQATNVNGNSRLDFRAVDGTPLYSLAFGNGNVIAPIPLSNDLAGGAVILTDNGPYGAAGGGFGVADNYRLVWQIAA